MSDKKTPEKTETDLGPVVIKFGEAAQKNAAGVYVVDESTVYDAMKGFNGTTKEDHKKVQDALDYVTSAAAEIATAHVENEIKADPEHKRRGRRSATVRLGTLGGHTEVEALDVRRTKIARKAGDEGPTHEEEFGVIRTNIVAEGRIFPSVHKSSRDRIRAALGVKD